MRMKVAACQPPAAVNHDGHSVGSRNTRRQEIDSILLTLRVPQTAQACLIELRRRTLNTLDALQASTWTLLERDIGIASRATAQRLAAVCGRQELRTVHDELLRVLEGVSSSDDSDMSDPRLCAELLSGISLLLLLGAELGFAFDTKH